MPNIFRRTGFILFILMQLLFLKGFCQADNLNNASQQAPLLFGKWHRLKVDSNLRNGRTRIKNVFREETSTTATDIRKRAKENYHLEQTRPKYLEWKDGRVPEFSNAYTLHRHELRLNLFGPCSFALTDRFEMKSYLQVIIVPNISFKYRFLDRGRFAVAFETGGLAGAFPAAAGAVMVPFPAAAGAAGFITVTDVFFKAYLSWKPSKKLTFSLRSEIAYMKLGYDGLFGLVLAGDNGGGVMVLPFSVGLLRTYWRMAGAEVDYVFDPRNALVIRSGIGKFLNKEVFTIETNRNSPNYLLNPSVSWNHAWSQRHLHLSVGLYGYFDPPSNVMTRKNDFPMSPYANLYWIFHNGIKKLSDHN